MSVPEPLSGTVRDGVHRLPVRVYYEDTDTGGIVYHAGYLRFMERGRSEYLRCVGIDQAAWLKRDGRDKLGWAVRRLAIDYLRPAVLDDALVVHTAIETVRGASVDMAQWVTRGRDEIVSARLTVAAIDGFGRPRRWPADVRQRFEHRRTEVFRTGASERERV